MCVCVVWFNLSCSFKWAGFYTPEVATESPASLGFGLEGGGERKQKACCMRVFFAPLPNFCSQLVTQSEVFVNAIFKAFFLFETVNRTKESTKRVPFKSMLKKINKRTLNTYANAL